MKSAPVPGTKIRMTANWLRNTGQVRGRAGLDRWIVQACACSMCSRGEFIATDERNCDDDGQRHINIANVETVRS